MMMVPNIKPLNPSAKWIRNHTRKFRTGRSRLASNPRHKRDPNWHFYNRAREEMRKAYRERMCKEALERSFNEARPPVVFKRIYSEEQLQEMELAKEIENNKRKLEIKRLLDNRPWYLKLWHSISNTESTYIKKLTA